MILDNAILQGQPHFPHDMVEVRGLSGGDHVDIKRDETSIGWRADRHQPRHLPNSRRCSGSRVGVPWRAPAFEDFLRLETAVPLLVDHDALIDSRGVIADMGADAPVRRCDVAAAQAALPGRRRARRRLRRPAPV
jgi:hypothetical protein